MGATRLSRSRKCIQHYTHQCSTTTWDEVSDKNADTYQNVTSQNKLPSLCFHLSVYYSQILIFSCASSSSLYPCHLSVPRRLLINHTLSRILRVDSRRSFFVFNDSLGCATQTFQPLILTQLPDCRLLQLLALLLTHFLKPHGF